MRITRAWLVRREACAEQVAIFNAEWPTGAELTRDNLRRAAVSNLDLDWLARHMLNPASRRAYYEAMAPARRVYDEAVAAARRVYDEAVAAA